MGCCASRTQLDAVVEPPQRSTPAAEGGERRRDEPTAEEKRARAAEAAESRQQNWRQGGTADPEKARSVQRRREKDELLARIYNRYATLGREPPIGLPSCDLEQLRRHLDTLR